MKRKRDDWDGLDLTAEELAYFKYCLDKFPDKLTPDYDDLYVDVQANSQMSDRTSIIYRAAFGFRYMLPKYRDAILRTTGQRKILSLPGFDRHFYHLEKINYALKITKINHISIMNGKLTTAAFKELANTSVTTLQVSFNYYSQISDTKFSSESFKNLTSLSLVYNNITAKFCIELNKLKITTLNLSHNQIKDLGARELARHPTVTNLDVSFNHITDFGGHAFRCCSIKKLILNGNDLTEVTAVALGREAVNTSHLEVKHNNINQNGMNALASNTKIITLKITPQWYYQTENENKLETHPLRRANGGRQAAIPTEVPSLVRLSLFQAKRTYYMKYLATKLPAELLQLARRKRI